MRVIVRVVPAARHALPPIKCGIDVLGLDGWWAEAYSPEVGWEIVEWQHRLARKWAALHFRDVNVETRDGQHVFEVEVHFDGLEPNMVRVGLHADGIGGGKSVRPEMKLVRQLPCAAGGFAYGAAVSADRPSTDYTARVMPCCDGVAVPLEVSRILWQG